MILSPNTFLLVAALGQTIYMLLLGAVALFLILLVLVQRGRGGGLAGALGGMGGSSAFGAKAGDIFTKITVVVATAWIVLCIAGSWMTPRSESLLDTGVAGPASEAVEGPALEAPLDAPADAGDEEGSAPEESSGEGDSAPNVPAETDAPAETSVPEESPETETPETE